MKPLTILTTHSLFAIGIFTSLMFVIITQASVERDNSNVINITTLQTVQRVGQASKDGKGAGVEALVTKSSNYLSLNDIKEVEKKSSVANKPDFWTTLYSIESKQGKLLYRPSNKRRNCDSTSSPCGHHQLSLQALKDISCTSKQCKRNRLNYQKSLEMSKKLLELNDKRLRKSGYAGLPEYQKYLIHQQGANGLKTIIASSQGKKLLSRTLKKNMASNSPYSYKYLRRMGSKIAAQKFLKHWEKKWKSEQKLIAPKYAKQDTIFIAKLDAPISVKTIVNKATSDKVTKKTTKTALKRVAKKKTQSTNKIAKRKIKKPKEDKSIKVPQFDEYELQIAMNLKID